jgi:Rps23 Pro-64 3,4-dihydroxylase Tpa1-like proline 4-hydroxylase
MMMIEIKKNFFDNDLIEELSTFAIKSYKSNKLRTNFSSWGDGIVQNSSAVLIYDIAYDHEIYKKLCKKFDTEDYNFTFQYWTQGSYIPWHDDGYAAEAGTVYLNKKWNLDWGGLFMWMDDSSKKIYAEKPEYNKLIFLSGNINDHSTTPVIRPLYGDTGQVMRTTLQFFSENTRRKIY